MEILLLFFYFKYRNFKFSKYKKIGIYTIFSFEIIKKI